MYNVHKLQGPERNYSSRCKPIVELQLLKANQEVLKDPDFEVNFKKPTNTIDFVINY